MMLSLVAVAAAMLAALLTRGGVSRRLPAALIPLALLALASPPQVPWPGVTRATLRSDAALAEVEAVLAATSRAGVVAVEGNGVHPDFVPLLADRVLSWEQPTSRLGLAELSWPRRVAVGEPVHVIGRLDVDDSLVVQLIGPDGIVDSVRTDSLFRLAVVPRAAGRWAMQLVVGRDTTRLGFHAIAPPRLRVLVLAGRPDFEVPALVRRLVAQDADVTVRTRLTADRNRTEQLGLNPIGARVNASMLDSLDLVVLATGAGAMLAPVESQLLAAAVASGLGLLHLTDAPLAMGPLVPFALQRSGAEWTARLQLDGIVLPGVAGVAPIVASDSLAYLRDSVGRGVAWLAARGRGAIGATAFVTAHRLALAGHPETEAAWWAALLGPLLRKPDGQWLVGDAAIVRRDEPLRLRWTGDEPPQAAVAEGETRSNAGMATGSDPDSTTLRLWPRDTGWMSVTGGGDTLDLLVLPRNALPGVVAAERQRAMSAAGQEAAPSAPRPGRAPLPRPVAWLLLLSAVAVAWRPR